jgi:hypothetical protein
VGDGILPTRWGVLLATTGAALLLSTMVAVGVPLLPAATTETGSGTYVGETALNYWQWRATDLRVCPVGLSNASTAVATPTVLPGTALTGPTSYQVPGTRAGAPSVRWTLVLTTRAPPRAEIEVRLVVGAGLPASQFTVYLRTPAVAPLAPVTFYLYASLGASAGPGLTVQPWTETSLACLAIGQCP